MIMTMALLTALTFGVTINPAFAEDAGKISKVDAFGGYARAGNILTGAMSTPSGTAIVSPPSSPFPEKSKPRFAEDRVIVKLASGGGSLSAAPDSASSPQSGIFPPDLGVSFTNIRVLNPSMEISNTGGFTIDSILASSQSFNSNTGSLNNVFVLTLEETGSDAVQNALEILNANPAVKIAEPDYLREIVATPNDPMYNAQYALEKINAESVWDITKGSMNVVVGVVDTGIEGTHPDLAPNLWVNPNPNQNGYINDIHGYNFTGMVGGTPTDTFGHGTHVAGIIGAKGNNGIGVSGINWNVSLAWLGIHAGGNYVSDSAAIEAIYYANSHNIPILNNSWGGGGYSEILKQAIADYNGLFVAAAGNNYGNNNDLSPVYPASYDLPNVISVASTDASDNLSYFSNYGPNSVHIAAPGSDILSTYLNDTYEYMGGTSMATPYVAGAAALIKSEKPEYPPEVIRDLLIMSARQVEELTPYNLNLLDAHAAVWYANGIGDLYTVTYEFLDGVTAPLVKKVIPGGRLRAPAEPSREGFVFDGWYTAALGGVPYNFSDAVNGDMSLYARWFVPEPGMYYWEFPDQNFRREALRLLNDLDGGRRTIGGFVSANDEALLASITSLNVSNKQISDLTGLQYFTGLTELDCSGNWLWQLDVSVNTQLIRLNCSGNWLWQLDVSANTKLRWLDCSENNLWQLDISANTGLIELNCSHNQLTGLNITGNTELTKLDGSFNQLASPDSVTGWREIGLVLDSSFIFSPQKVAFTALQNEIYAYAYAAEDMVVTVGTDIPMTSLLWIPENPYGKTLTLKSDNGVRKLVRQYSGDLIYVASGAKLILENIIVDGNRDAFPDNWGSLVYIYGENGVSGYYEKPVELAEFSPFYGDGHWAARPQPNDMETCPPVSCYDPYLDTLGIPDEAYVYAAFDMNTFVTLPAPDFIYGYEKVDAANIANLKAGQWAWVEGEWIGYVIIVPKTTTTGGTFVMNSGAVLQNNYSWYFGGGVYASGGKFTMNGGEIRGNAANAGSGVYVLNGDITINGGIIRDNTASGAGGGVFLYEGKFTMSGGLISSNIAGGGGGVSISTFGAFTMTGGQISGNTVNSSIMDFFMGGGVSVGSSGYNEFKLGGTAVVFGNIQDGANNNIYLPYGQYITLGTGPGGNGAAAPAPGMYVGVTKTGYDNEIAQSAKPGDETYFFADEYGKRIVYDAGLLRVIGDICVGSICLPEGSSEMVIPNSQWLTSTVNIPAGSTFTIRSADAANPVTLTALRSFAFTGSMFIVNSGATLILENIIIDGAKDTYSGNSSSLVYVESGGRLIMKSGAVLRNNRASEGGGVYVAGGSFIMNDGEITGNETHPYDTGWGFFNGGNGGGVYVASGTFSMTGGEIIGNEANLYDFAEGWTAGGMGGGVYVVGNSTFTMSGGEIGNNAATYGAGVYMGSDSAFTMSGGEIIENEANLCDFAEGWATGGLGGGVYVVGGYDYGELIPGLYFYSGGGAFTMTGGEISGNTAYSGGGVFVALGVDNALDRDDYGEVFGGKFTMTGGEIIGNAASSMGGGVYVPPGFVSDTYVQVAGEIVLGGKAVIRDNTNDNVNLVSFFDNTYITLGTGSGGNGVAAPAIGMEVWVTKIGSDNVIVESGANANHAKYFFADANRGRVVHENDQLRIYINDDENASVISTGSATVTRGKTVSVPVILENNPGIVSMRLNVAYDSRWLTLESVTDYGLLGTNGSDPDYGGSPYTLVWEGLLSENITANGTIAELTFRVSEDAPEGSCAIRLSYNYSLYDIMDKNLNPVYFNLVHGVLNVIPYVYGDANNDGYVNLADIMALSRWLARWSTVPWIHEGAADVDIDSFVTMRDLLVLRRYFANWTGYETLPWQPQPQGSPFMASVSAFRYGIDPVVPAINVSSATGNVGDIVEVNIGLMDNPGIAAMRLGVEYDNSALRLVEAIDRGMLGNSYHHSEYDSPEITLLWENGASRTNFTYSGEVATLRFEILTETAGTPVAVNYDWAKYDVLDTELQPVYFEVNGGFVSTPESNEAVLIGAKASAWVKKLNGNKNELTIAVTETYSDGSAETITETFSINNNAAGSYRVGSYVVYVDTKGNDQIRQCYIVE